MAALSDFYPFVMPEVQGASDLIVDQAILRAAREFCQKSLSVRLDLPLIDVVADVADYALAFTTALANQVHVTEVMRVEFDGRELDPIAPDTLDYDRATRGGVSGYCREGTGILRLLGAPSVDAAAALKVRVASQPRMTATTLADELLIDWGEQIAAGAKAVLMMMPGREYASEKVASMHRMNFLSAINSALVQANKGNARAQLRVRVPRGGL